MIHTSMTPSLHTPLSSPVDPSELTRGAGGRPHAQGGAPLNRFGVPRPPHSLGCSNDRGLFLVHCPPLPTSKF